MDINNVSHHQTSTTTIHIDRGGEDDDDIRVEPYGMQTLSGTDALVGRVGFYSRTIIVEKEKQPNFDH